MAYSLTYQMQTGSGVRSSASAAEALRDHTALLMAHANSITIWDARSLVVTLPALVALAKLDPHRS